VFCKLNTKDNAASTAAFIVQTRTVSTIKIVLLTALSLLFINTFIYIYAYTFKMNNTKFADLCIIS
jgi:peptidoglycan biosynthesis protein MviN/MurJ (putative lipid II flippase)